MNHDVIVHVGGVCDNNGHGGWGVTKRYGLKDTSPQEYQGHILTGEEVTAEKMAMILGLALANEVFKGVTTTMFSVLVRTSSLQSYAAYYNPNPEDIFDQEIQELKKDRPNVEVWYVTPERVNDAKTLAMKGCLER